MITYISKYMADDEKWVDVATELMRYVEDQFVLWGKYPKQTWISDEPRLTPAGLEQYLCYHPISSSTSTIMNAFISMYQLKKDRLYLEKALTLGDVITRVQVPEDGKIPTFWIGEKCAYGHENFWLNCQIADAFAMMNFADLIEEEGIE